MSGPSSLPPAPPSAPTQSPSTRDGQAGRILTADGNLAQLARPATVTGQVVAINSNGSVRIHTDQGDLDIQLRGQSVPPPGQTVEIDVSAGRPPRQATVRSADNTNNTPSQSAPTSAAPSSSGVAPAPPSSADLDSETNNGATSNSPQTTASGRLPPPLLAETLPAALAQTLQTASQNNATAQVAVRPGDLLRLQPLPPGTPILIDGEIALPLDATLSALTPPLALPAATVAGVPIAGATVAGAPVIGAAVTGLPAGGAPAITTTGAALKFAALPTVLPPPPVRPLVPGAIVPALLTGVGPATPAPAASGLRPTPVTVMPAAVSGPPPAIRPTSLLQTGPVLATARPASVIDVRVTGIQSPAVRFTGLTPPAAGGPTGPSPVIPRPSVPLLATAAGSVTGTIVGHVEQPGFGDLPVFSVTLPGAAQPQLFVLQVGASNLPAGSTVTITPQTAADDAEAVDTDVVAASETQPSPQWPALNDINTALAATPHAGTPLFNLLPNPALPENIPAAALFFVAALRSGDMASWLGERAVDALRRSGRADAIDRLSDTGDLLGKLDAPRPNPDDWRVLALPMAWDGEVQRMILHYRRDRGGSGDNEPKDKTRGTRFVFDMKLTRMGPVQLDGLHRPGRIEQKAEHRLDLIVRTRVGLSAPMQAEMRSRYIGALQNCGHVGEMSFQHRREQWLKI